VYVHLTKNNYGANKNLIVQNIQSLPTEFIWTYRTLYLTWVHTPVHQIILLVIV